MGSTGSSLRGCRRWCQWDDLWAGMHIPRDTWMPCKRTAQHPIAFARLHKPLTMRLRCWSDLTQVAAISGSMMMPCLRSTIASLGTSGESQYSVAVLLGAIGAEQTLFSIIGPAIVSSAVC